MKCLKLLCAVLCLCLLNGCAAAEMRFADFTRKYERLFLNEGSEWTENTYRSENMQVELSSQRVCNTDVYVADIHVRTVQCLQRVFGGDAWDTISEKVDAFAKRTGAVLTLTGDNSHHLKAGWTVGNGRLCRKRGNNMRDLCVLYTDGTMQIHYARPDHELIARQTAEGCVWQTFVFGPALLDEQGKALEDFSASDVEPSNPRAVIGYYEPGHYCLVQVDGRSTQSALEDGRLNDGMKLTELAQFMESLGCKAAYNLDGGQSAVMCFGENVISTPYHDGRAVGDVIVLCEPEHIVEDPENFLVE